MLTRSNENEAKPRYYTPGAGADWQGGAPGNEADVATSTVALASSASAAVAGAYGPRTQTAKGAGMVPALSIEGDIGADYGAYTGEAGRTGTIQPRQPYPAVKP